MQQDELRLSRCLGLVLIDNYRITIVGRVNDALGGKAQLVNLSRPKVTRNGREMGIGE